MSFAVLQVFNLNGGYQAYHIEPETIIHLGGNEQNSIVLDGPSIAPFHLALQCHQATCEVIAFTAQGSPLVNGQFLIPNQPTALSSGSIIRVANYELRFFIVPPRTQPEDAWLQPVRSDPEADQRNPIAARLVGVPENGLLPVKPGDRVTLQVQVTNQGQRYAAFAVRTTGVPVPWVTSGTTDIRPGETDILPLMIAPPEKPNSVAQDYPLRLWISSPEYPEYNRELRLTLHLLPFYKFETGDLRPRRRTLSWWRTAASYTFAVGNQGNAPAEYRLKGEDADDDCFFEFGTPAQEQLLAQEAPLRVPGPPPEAFKNGYRPQPERVTLFVTPQSRPLFLRKKEFPFTITVKPLAGDQELSTLRGRVVQKPLFGPWFLLFVGLIILFVCAAAALYPRWYIWRFKVNNLVTQVSAEPGEELTVEWLTSPFVASARIKPGGELIVGQSQGSLIVTPEKDTTAYVLEAESYLTFLVPGLRATRVVPLSITPVTPQIELSVSDTDVIDEEVNFSADVTGADEAFVVINGTAVPLSPEAPQIEGTLVLSEDTTIEVEARTGDVIVSKQVDIAVSTPTPQPKIEQFTFSSDRIVAGQPLQLDLNLTTGDQVVLDPLGVIEPPVSLRLFPQESTNYTVKTINPEGTVQVLATQQVMVDQPTPTATATPTATPVPLAPTIVEFNASKTFIKLGEIDDNDDGDNNEVITLFWTVEGEVTDIQLLNKDGVALQTNLPPVGQTNVLVDENDDLFILVALNQDKETRSRVHLDIKKVPNIFFFKAEISSASYEFLNGCSTTADHFEKRRRCIITPTLSTTTALTITFSWETDAGSRVELQPFGDQPHVGNLVVTPDIISSTEQAEINKNKFTLYARNEAGETRRKILICPTEDTAYCPK